MSISIKDIDNDGNWTTGKKFEVIANQDYSYVNTAIYELYAVQGTMALWHVISRTIVEKYGEVTGISFNDTLDDSGIVLKPLSPPKDYMGGPGAVYWNNKPDVNTVPPLQIGDTYTYTITIVTSGYVVYTFVVPSNPDQFPAGNYYLKYCWIEETRTGW